jgi:hypothetical protein
MFETEAVFFDVQPTAKLQPVTTFANYLCTVNIAQLFRQLGVPRVLLLHVGTANQPTITGVSLCQKMSDTPAVDYRGLYIESC